MSEKTIQIVANVMTFFDKVDVKFWLYMGALLGAVRDGVILRWDYDVDLGCNRSDMAKVIRSLSWFVTEEASVVVNEKFGNITILPNRPYSFFNINMEFLFETDTCFWRFHHSKRFYKLRASPISFLFLRLLMQCLNISNHRFYSIETPYSKLKHLSSLLPKPIKSLISNLSWTLHKKLRLIVPHVYPKFFNKLSTILFYGEKVFVPENYEAYLSYHYGDDWHTPNKQWRYYAESGALQPILTSVKQ